MKKTEKAERKSEKKKRGISRILRWGAPVQVALFCLLGVLLLCLPADSAKALAFVLGAVFAGFGVLFLETAFAAHSFELLRIFVGAAFIALAVWLFVQPEEAVAALLYVITVLVFLRGVLGLWNSLSLKRAGGMWWQVQLVEALAVAVCAFVILFVPVPQREIVTVILGVLALVDAFFELIGFFLRLFSGKKKTPHDPTEKTPKEEPEETSSEPPEENKPRPSRFRRRKEKGGTEGEEREEKDE